MEDTRWCFLVGAALLFQGANLSRKASRLSCESSAPSTYYYYMDSHQPAQYCQECHFPFKQMGACPYPDRSLFWAVISMVPYLIPIIFFVVTVFTRKMEHLKFVVLLGSAYLFGDKIVKNLLRSPRPSFSCKKTYGMPSSHMIVVVAIFLSRLTKVEAHIMQKLLWLGITILQGFSRVLLNYHTWEQVLGGTLFGIVYTLVFNRLWDSFVEPFLRERFASVLSIQEEEESK